MRFSTSAHWRTVPAHRDHAHVTFNVDVAQIGIIIIIIVGGAVVAVAVAAQCQPTLRVRARAAKRCHTTEPIAGARLTKEIGNICVITSRAARRKCTVMHRASALRSHESAPHFSPGEHRSLGVRCAGQRRSIIARVYLRRSTTFYSQLEAIPRTTSRGCRARCSQNAVSGASHRAPVRYQRVNMAAVCVHVRVIAERCVRANACGVRFS